MPSKPRPRTATSWKAVVVTGIRHGIEDAIEIKRDSGSIVEAISAEDIGKLPDTSIAESISRLPGPHFAARRRTRFGHQPARHRPGLHDRAAERPRAGQHRRQSQHRVRPVPVRAPELRRRLQDAGLRTRRPGSRRHHRPAHHAAADYGRRAMVFNMRGERIRTTTSARTADDKGYRASFSYIDQFVDDTLGVTFGVARLDVAARDSRRGHLRAVARQRHSRRRRCEPDRRHQSRRRGRTISSPTASRCAPTWARTGATARWRRCSGGPSDNFTSIFDVYYTRRKQEDNARSLEVNLGGYPGAVLRRHVPGNTAVRLLESDDPRRHRRRRRR